MRNPASLWLLHRARTMGVVSKMVVILAATEGWLGKRQLPRPRPSSPMLWRPAAAPPPMTPSLTLRRRVLTSFEILNSTDRMLVNEVAEGLAEEPFFLYIQTRREGSPNLKRGFEAVDFIFPINHQRWGPP